MFDGIKAMTSGGDTVIFIEYGLSSANSMVYLNITHYNNLQRTHPIQN